MSLEEMELQNTSCGKVYVQAHRPCVISALLNFLQFMTKQWPYLSQYTAAAVSSEYKLFFPKAVFWSHICLFSPDKVLQIVPT